MAPVHAGLIRYESLTDGKLTLEDIAFLNDSLMVKWENEYLREEARRNAQKKH